MTIGISKKDLIDINPWEYDNQQDLLNAIIEKCKEINPRLPIDENTPKDRRLSLYWPGIGWITGGWVKLNANVGYFTHDLSKYDPPPSKPTHYQELPNDPKE